MSEGKRDPSNCLKIPDAMIEPMVRFETADRKAKGGIWRLQRTDKTKWFLSTLVVPGPEPESLLKHSGNVRMR